MPGGKSLYRNCSLFKLYRTNGALTQTLSAPLDPISFCLCETQTEAVSPCIPLRSLIDFFPSFSFHHVVNKTHHSQGRGKWGRGEFRRGLLAVQSRTASGEARFERNPWQRVSLSLAKGSFPGQLFSVAVWVGETGRKTGSRLINGRAALESVSFLTEDWALSWNVSCLSAASASFSGAATFSSLERRVEGGERDLCYRGMPRGDMEGWKRFG